VETEESLCYMNEFVQIIQLYLNTLDNNKVYKLLPAVKGQSSYSDEVSIHTISEGIIISRGTDATNLALRLRFDLVSTISRYSLEAETSPSPYPSPAHYLNRRSAPPLSLHKPLPPPAYFQYVSATAPPSLLLNKNKKKKCFVQESSYINVAGLAQGGGV